MLIETPGGFDYTGADCAAWMKEAGYSSTRVEPLVGPDSMVIGSSRSTKDGHMRNWLGLIVAASILIPASVRTQGRPSLEIYAIDVEGGQSTLLVAPSGESLLIDAGNPGDRDADRIAATAKEAGVTRIDYLVVTHYDADHVGGVKDVAERLPIRTFVDHGPRTPPPGSSPLAPEAQVNVDRLDQRYGEARLAGRHMEAKAGDTIPIHGLDVRVVSSKAAVIAKPLAGGGAPNPLCASFTAHPVDTSENIFSVGLVIGAFGRFRMLDLGDLTWNTEHDLVCPNNLLGAMDLYITTHHGLARSGPPALVHAIRPKVVIINNGPQKGNSRETWQTLKGSPGLEDIWQLHYSVDRPPQPRMEETGRPGGQDANAAESFIANLVETPPTHSPAYALKVSVRPDGSFVVSNPRAGYAKTYTSSR
jgi:competence protein ComEC